MVAWPGAVPQRPEHALPPASRLGRARGGDWGNNPYGIRVSYRHGNPSDIGLDMVGFRCAADPA
ncbi:MAG TPA: hypothetical protein VFZ01_09510 [Geminicoccaceae bacterium]